MMKTIYLFLLIFPLSAFYSSPDFELTPYQKEHKYKEIADNAYRIKTVVLDAGHGGIDAGCNGKNSKEKHIALNVVLKLGRAIETHFPTVKVIYTRSKDVFIPLYQRAAIANKNNADLFISVHCNALGHNAHLVMGSETYVMGLHTAEHNLEVARRENESILLEEDYEKNYQGFDPNSDEGHIFLSMYQNAFLDQSILFAEKVEKNIKIKARRKSRGVKQAGFVVLKETTMPSVLIETGYLTNRKDEAFLMTNSGQAKIANAIFEAFKDYKLEVEDQNYKPSSPQVQTPNNEEIVAEIIVPASTNSVATPKETARAKAVPTKLILSAEKKPEASKKEEPIVQFKIQLAASPSQIEISGKKWSQVPYVEMRQENHLYKYLTGSHTFYEEAVKNRNDLLKKGFNGAFIVAYKNGKRVSLKEVRK